MINRMIKVSAIVSFLTFICVQGICQSNDAAILEIKAHRDKQQNEFRDRKKSPLEKRDRRHFKGLNYYPIDLAYSVKGKFVKTENPELFKMKTTTSRLPEYVKYGEVYFTLQGKELKLEVYQSPDIMKRPGYEDYLFIPFTDETNGKETYDVGRYLEFRIPASADIKLDFNLCYNPYCSYNGKYSCPIPPATNDLPVAVHAGEKLFRPSSH